MTQGNSLPILCIVLPSIGLCLVSARIYSRVFITKALGLDDLFILIAFGFAIALSVLITIEVKDYKIDRHIWDIPLSLATGNRLFVWCGEICYVAATGCVKISILLFYRRLSISFSRAFKIATWIGIGYNVLYMLVFFLNLLLQCHPLQSYWLQFDKAWLEAGNTWSCPSSEHFTLPISGGLSLIGDAYSTLLPLCLVYTLDLPQRQKVALYSLFALGFLVVAAGIVRTVELNYLINETYDNSWYLYRTWIWALVELYVAVFAASAPALKPFFRKFFIEPIATIASNSKNRSNAQGYGPGSRRNGYNKWRNEKGFRGDIEHLGPVTWSQDTSTIRNSMTVGHGVDVEKIGVAVTRDQVISEDEEEMEMEEYQYRQTHRRRLSRDAGTQTSFHAIPSASQPRAQTSPDHESNAGVSPQPSQAQTTSSQEWILAPGKAQNETSDPLRAYHAEIQALPTLPSEEIQSSPPQVVRRTASLEQQRHTLKEQYQMNRPGSAMSGMARESFRPSGSVPPFSSTHQGVSSPRSLNSHPPNWSPHTPSPPTGTGPPSSSNPHTSRHQSTSSVRTLQVRPRQIQVARAEEVTTTTTGVPDEEIDYTVLDPPIVAGAYVSSNMRADSRLATSPGYSSSSSDDDDDDEAEEGVHTRRHGRPLTWNTNTLLDGSPDQSDDDRSTSSDYEPEHPPVPHLEPSRVGRAI